MARGGPIPTDVGVHRQKIGAGYRSALISHGTAIDKPRECIPWTSVQDITAREGWYAARE